MDDVPASPGSTVRESPTASYRLQLTPEFGFDAAVGVLDSVAAMGVSHLYLSPIATAVPTSGHGYDVTDHTTVREEFGGSAGLTRLLDAADRAGLGVIIDHVPNHVSVEHAHLNHPWWMVLRDGPSSPRARWFDIDWESAGNRLIIPRLGEPVEEALANGAFEVGSGDLGPELRYGPLRFPLASGTEHLPLGQLIERQHYQLTYWRSPERNVRRFFTIDDLVAVCVEHEDVAKAVDTIPRALTAHPAFAGVRVDHVDGLADPGTYLRQLRELLGDRLLFVEKIVTPGEELPSTWPVDGTTGYEHIVDVDHVLLDPAAEASLMDVWEQHGGRDTFEELDRVARREVLEGDLRPDLERVVRSVDRVSDGPDTRSAVIDLTLALDRYRTYLPERASMFIFDAVVERAKADQTTPVERGEMERVASVIASDATAQRRWQQLTGPAMAKGVEDRAFYRWFPLASLSEVGGSPDTFSTSVTAFHQRQLERQHAYPRAMLADTTHDTKRSSAVRSRSLALAADSERWRESCSTWFEHNADGFDLLEGGIILLALQTAITAQPIDAERLGAYLVKAAREADQITSWTRPDARVEDQLAALAEVLTADVQAGTLADFSATVTERGDMVGRRVLAIQLTCPGFADLYQGTPLRLASLVDPDNRRAPDWDAIATLMQRASSPETDTSIRDGDADFARAVLVRRLLDLRRRRAEAFGPDAGYEVVEATGEGSELVLAFARTARGQPTSVTIAVRAVGRADAASGVSVVLPPGRWVSVVDGRERSAAGGPCRLLELVGTDGFDVLERHDSDHSSSM